VTAQSTGSTLDAYNQFDPVTKNVLVYGIDGNGVSFGPITPTVIKTPWSSGDDCNISNHDHDADNLYNYYNNGNGNNGNNGNNNGNYNNGNNGANTNNHDDDDDDHGSNGNNDQSGAIYNHDDDNKNAELRTFTINNGGNSLILVEKVLMENDKITIHVISVQRNGGAVVQLPQNLKMFEWTDDKDNDGSSPGNMETFQQTMIVTNGKLTQQITTSFDDEKKQTVVYTQNINENFKHKNHLSDEIVKSGLVYLRMLTHQNSLTIGTSS